MESDLCDVHRDTRPRSPDAEGHGRRGTRGTRPDRRIPATRRGDRPEGPLPGQARRLGRHAERLPALDFRVRGTRPLAVDAARRPDCGRRLFPLFMRAFAPLPRRLESIIGRLERSPAFLEETKGRIRTPIKIWSEISLEAATRLPGFLQVIEATGKENLAGPDRGRLEESVANTGEAIRAYGKWIESDVLPRSKDRVGIGGAKFRKLVRLRELEIGRASGRERGQVRG